MKSCIIFITNMKFLAPKTLHGTFAPIYLVNFIFGIGVVHYPIGKPRPIISAIWSIINFLIYLSFVILADLPELVDFSGSTVVASNYRNFAYIFTVYIVISMCLVQINSKIIIKSFMNLSYMNDKLKKLGIPDDYDLAFKAQIIYYTIGFIYIIMIIVLDFIYIKIDTPSKISSVCFLLSAHHWVIFSFVADSSCIITTRYFSNRFKRFNWLFVESNLHKIYERLLNEDSYNLNIQSKIPMLKEIHGNLTLNRIADNQRMLYIIRESRKIHRNLCTTVTELNSVFGIQLLFSFGLSTGLITALLYNSYVLLTNKSEDWLLDDAMLKIIPLLWTAFYILKIFLIIHTCSNANDETKRTVQLIHTLLNSTIIYNEDVRNELTMFSLQLLQNPLQLTACGFFTVDNELARAMLGSVFTFVIIMIQMRSVYET